MWLTGLVAPWHVGSSQTRARTRVPCIGRQILNHCATREAPVFLVLSSYSLADIRVYFYQRWTEVILSMKREIDIWPRADELIVTLVKNFNDVTHPDCHTHKIRNLPYEMYPSTAKALMWRVNDRKTSLSLD